MPPARDLLADRFPPLAGDLALFEAIVAAAEHRVFAAGTQLFGRGAECGVVGFFLGGAVRVFAAGSRGREITLYEIAPGELCILNALCALSRRRYPAEARVLEETQVLVLPAADFRRLFVEHGALRDFLFGLFADRLVLIMELVEEVSFGSLERRLDDYLVERAEHDVVRLTHQAIANDLGSSREVVSRLLKDFERRGRVRLGRSEITLLDTDA